MNQPTTENVIIIGSGPAGWTAGIYAGRATLSPLLFAGQPRWPDMLPGGQLMTTTEIENFPGFEDGILGPELMDTIQKQARRYGCRVVEDDAVGVDFSQQPYLVRDGAGNEYRSWTVIIATGARPRKLGIPGENEFFGGKGVSSCAICDGAFFKNKVVCVIGGGDSAMEEALFLTHHATKVYVIHRRDELRASKIMQQRAFENPKIEFVWNSMPLQVLGDQKVKAVQLKNVKTGAESVLEIDGYFLAIGHIPNTDNFKGKIALHETGYVIVDHLQRCMSPGGPQTPLEGVFAAGDCHDHAWRQAVTAAAFGCMAALSAERFLATISDRTQQAR
jgi:thioredoxin reductase (NADPH)